MATYNVGGLALMNRNKTIYDALAKALSGDEIFWNKSEKHEKSLMIKNGIHLFCNKQKWKVPEHSVGIILAGSGTVVIEDLTIICDSLSNGIRLKNWVGTVHLKNCSIIYKNRIRQDKAYSLFTTDEFLENCNIIMDNCKIEGFALESNSIEITNSHFIEKYSSSSMMARSLTASNLILDGGALSAVEYTIVDSTARGTVRLISKGAKIANTLFGDDVNTQVEFKGNTTLDNLTFEPTVSQITFNEGEFGLSNLEIPNILVVAEDSTLNFFDGVKDSGMWQTTNSIISNQSKDNTVIGEQARTKSAKEQLNEMIGLKNVKELMNQYIAMARINRQKEEKGFETTDFSLHMIFGGSPGTGKTTVGKIFSQALFEEGVLPTSKFVYATRPDFVGEHIGETAIKTKKLVESAYGGILFIDEAYELNGKGKNDFGGEAISELIAHMENNRKELIVIMAGYTKEMKDFMQTGNPGLVSRFNNWVEFPDYSLGELTAILNSVMKKSYIYSVETRDLMELKLFSFYNKKLINGNARFVRNFIQEIVFAQSIRLSSIQDATEDDLQLITAEDVNEAYNKMIRQIESRN